MQILFLNGAPQTRGRRRKIPFLPLDVGKVPTIPIPPSWGQVLVEQLVNSLIVGGIAGLAALSADTASSWKVAGIAFGLTFLVELRKYRKL